MEIHKTKKQLDKIKEFIEKRIDKRHDKVKYYYICKSCYLKSSESGKDEKHDGNTQII